MCYLFEDTETAKSYFDQQVQDMFSYYDESTYKIEDNDNGSVLTYEQDGVTAVMEVNGELFTLEEVIGG